jgi:hypothetical protein
MAHEAASKADLQAVADEQARQAVIIDRLSGLLPRLEQLLEMLPALRRAQALMDKSPLGWLGGRRG